MTGHFVMSNNAPLSGRGKHWQLTSQGRGLGVSLGQCCFCNSKAKTGLALHRLCDSMTGCFPGCISSLYFPPTLRDWLFSPGKRILYDKNYMLWIFFLCLLPLFSTKVGECEKDITLPSLVCLTQQVAQVKVVCVLSFPHLSVYPK